MASVLRYLTSFFEDDGAAEPGLFQKADGTVWVRLPGGGEAQVTGGGGGGGGFPANYTVEPNNLTIDNEAADATVSVGYFPDGTGFLFVKAGGGGERLGFDSGGFRAVLPAGTSGFIASLAGATVEITDDYAFLAGPTTYLGQDGGDVVLAGKITTKVVLDGAGGNAVMLQLEDSGLSTWEIALLRNDFGGGQVESEIALRGEGNGRSFVNLRNGAGTSTAHVGSDQVVLDSGSNTPGDTLFALSSVYWGQLLTVFTDSFAVEAPTTFYANVGFYAKSPVPQPAAPVTLGDVIAALKALGLVAS